MAFIAFVALGFGALMAIQIQMSNSGCGSIDPTDDGNYSRVSIKNDTDTEIVIDNCQGGYCENNFRRTVASEASTRVEAVCAATGSDMTSWKVTRQDGTALGFIAVDTPRKHDGLVYDVSDATQSRDQPTRPAPDHP